MRGLSPTLSLSLSHTKTNKWTPTLQYVLDSQVGYETVNSSDDQILKQDMPPALTRVEESSLLLLDASDLLRADPYSGPARKKLIEGSRGQGLDLSSLTYCYLYFVINSIPPTSAESGPLLQPSLKETELADWPKVKWLIFFESFHLLCC